MNWFKYIDTTSKNERIGFNAGIVGKLSQAQIFVGIASMLFGLVVEISGAFIECKSRYCHRVYFSFFGAGIWCGLIFIAVGYLGAITARRKSTCFIVALMAFAMSATIFAGLQITISICAMALDRNLYGIRGLPRPTRWWHDYDERYYYEETSTVPVASLVFNLIVTLLGFLMLGLLVTTVVYSSIATCCQSQPNYLRINVYERVSTPSSFYSRPIQTPDQMQPQPGFNPGGPVYYAPQGYGGTSQGETQPLVLMPNHQFIPVQYQTGGAPYQNHPFTSSPQQAGSEPSRTTDVYQDAAEVPVQQIM